MTTSNETSQQPVQIIGYRVEQSIVTDVVTIHCSSVRIEFSNPVIVLPIPTTGNTTTPSSKLINLKRITRRIILFGYIIDTNYVNLQTNLVDCGISSGAPNNTVKCDGSARAVVMDSSGVLTYTGSCTAVKNVFHKKWILEQFAQAGVNSGKGLTVQWRGIKNPSGSEYTKNDFSEKCFISELTFTDDAKVMTTYDASGNPYPHFIGVSMTLVVGEPTA